MNKDVAMRSRTNSGVRLDYYQRLLYRTILCYQDPVTGLLPASPTDKHAWIRDNIYSIMSVWGLSMAYKKNADMDEDRAKTYELEQVNSETGQAVVGDAEWGHLQIDAVSLFLLTLAQMTASGLQIVFTLDEVAFIQNLVFYIESAYCVPDYGIWERGDKSNHGLPELNASSIGMAKAALEAMNELDLFGARGGPARRDSCFGRRVAKMSSCFTEYVLRFLLQSMLPRESNSKEVDSSLLSIISFPAFAVDDPDLIRLTRKTIVQKLHGMDIKQRGKILSSKCTFGHEPRLFYLKALPVELYYEPWELRMFDNIECEWPLFYCSVIIDACFRDDQEAIIHYSEALDEILIKTEDGLRLVPELYAVPASKVNDEYRNPGSQKREPVGRCPFMWAQRIFSSREFGFALNRRLCAEKKPDVVVQVVILAEDAEIQDKLKHFDIHVQTIAEVAPIEVQPARVLSHLYAYLGRQSRDVGILCTSKLYSLQDKIFAFTPQLMDPQRFYIASDYELMIDNFKNELNFLKSSWQNVLGRPLVVFTFRHSFDLEENYMMYDSAVLAHNFINDLAFLTNNWSSFLGRPTVVVTFNATLLREDGKVPMSIITTIKKLRSGYTVGTRVTLGFLQDFLSTSCITNLSFLGSVEDGIPEKLHPSVQEYLEEQLQKSFTYKAKLPLAPRTKLSSGKSRKPSAGRRLSLKGTIKRTRSIYRENFVEEPTTSWRESRRVTHQYILVGPVPRSPSPVETASPTRPRPAWAPLSRTRTHSDAQFENTEIEELITMLRETESLEEQGDILHYLVVSHGLDYPTGVDDNNEEVKVKDLLKGLYDKACQQKLWGLVRHSAGMLGKRVEDLAKAVTDLLVRQKQVTVGMPPNHEKTITGPLPEIELRQLIHSAYGDDESTAMLTQELLVYLAMFIRTEPHLFLEMLRLRVGLIIQVMATELARTLKCGGDDASECLLNLSPFEMKNLLYHIMSGKEFAQKSGYSYSHSVITTASTKVSKAHIDTLFCRDADQTDVEKQQGQWLRRRRLDGALNRVPRGFYPRVWAILERCQGLAINGKVLSTNLTQEMTSGELKFALRVEAVLNTISQPEYRQLVVEALMVLTLVVEHNLTHYLGDILYVEQLVVTANKIFLQDQVKSNGDATLCCAKDKSETGGASGDQGGLLCGGAATICQHFYDSAPSGCFGTMTYLVRAVAQTLHCLPKDGQIDCNIS
ncbi:putative phosphorylase b kinase regulatory subunit alpha [Orchesella cincta]|uniref:Phosphorylase b kinase regulatory subunit n=1 Tax=Orchesella cincta TaxID=48709 RepID=A0A1D2NMN2_ORCCI|nr:putative phosphorylase b kinase regulatory subunit alpha [Orchesella cincta]